MGCAIVTEQKDTVRESNAPRDNKKTQKIDCRKKSLQAVDIIRENITILSETLDPANLQFACNSLKQHSLFTTLDEQQIREVAATMQVASADKDSYVFREGETGVCFFLIKSGQVEVEISGRVTKTLGKGQCFGEVALVYFTKRTASIRCKSDAEFLILKSMPFKATMRRIRDAHNQRTKNLIENVQIFALLTTKQKYTLMNSLVRQHYKKDTVIFKKNDTPVSFYIIESGKVGLYFEDQKKKDIILGELQSFGESAFKANAKRQGTAVVTEDAVCLTINQQKMKQSLGGTLSSIVYHNIKKWALKSSPVFHNYSNKDLDQIALQFVAKVAKTNDIVMDMDKTVDALIICVEGKINSKPPGTLFNDEYFKLEEKRHLEKDLIKNETGVYAILSFDKLKQVLENLHTKGSLITAKRRQSTILKQNQQLLNLNNLQYLKKLGEGQFGLVHLVKDKRSGNLFALKCLQKQKIRKEAMQDSAISQRQILANICHPLIVGYYKAYQDSKNIYFLLEYIEGIEMFQAIREIGILNKIAARFYIGSLLMAVQYLHSKNIIYRDIKPQNSIVDYQGKVYLIDMGTAKMLKSDNGYRTDTIIGTPHYMAPQVMQGKGYSFQADYWSLGVLFYELICGRLPFAQNIDNPYQVYAQVMASQLTFPNFVTDQSAKTIIRKLLMKNIANRSAGGLAGIRNSPYFDTFNWQDLYQGKTTPPYIPKKFRQSTNPKYSEMQGYPLPQFLQEPKKKTDKKTTQEFKLWTNSIIQ